MGKWDRINESKARLVSRKGLGKWDRIDESKARLVLRKGLGKWDRIDELKKGWGGGSVYRMETRKARAGHSLSFKKKKR